jgi:multidrug efflux pump subunit AcrB
MLATMSTTDPFKVRTPEELATASQQFIAAASQRPEMVGLFTGYGTTVPELKLDVDRDKTKTLGIPVNTIFDSLQIYLARGRGPALQGPRRRRATTGQRRHGRPRGSQAFPAGRSSPA